MNSIFWEVHDWSASVNCFQNISGPDQKSITNTIEVSKIYIFYEPLLLKFQSSMQWNFSCAFWIFSLSKVRTGGPRIARVQTMWFFHLSRYRFRQDGFKLPWKIFGAIFHTICGSSVLLSYYQLQFNNLFRRLTPSIISSSLPVL